MPDGIARRAGGRLPWRPAEECGVFGIFDHPEAARLTYYGLYALQHRGQESAGIAVSDGRCLAIHKGMGLVSEVFGDETINGLGGTSAIGHVRYSTTGSSLLANAQPLVVRHRRGELALAHNGNLVNAAAIRQELEEEGSIFQTTVDTEVVAHLVARAGRNGIESAVEESLRTVQGGFAFVFLTPDRLLAARDPNGFRPLSLGRLGDAWVVASESCAFDTVGAEFVRDVAPGELVIVDGHGLRSVQVRPAVRPSLCVFEYIYFARPDSNLNGLNVHAARKNLGRQLAREHPADADLVTGVPDSSISAATGYAEEAGIPYEVGLVKNRYVGRTFIQPAEVSRVTGVRLKLNALRKVVEGRRVVLVDDSIVRGTTSRHIVGLLRSAGAREVHLRISSPPYLHPCHYGIDTSAAADLVATGKAVEEIRRLVDADSLGYLSATGMQSAINGGAVDADREGGGRHCLACFNGDYPVNVAGAAGKFALEGVRR